MMKCNKKKNDVLVFQSGNTAWDVDEHHQDEIELDNLIEDQKNIYICSWRRWTKAKI
jgi:hypothetical protein